MLKKCLKYDFKAPFRLWLIFSIIFMSIAVVSGFALSGLDSENGILTLLSGLSILPGYFAVIAYPMAIIIILIARCYTSFFTDEGYLTFTLPVRRRTLLHSKLISAWCYMTATLIVVAIGLLTAFGIMSLIGKTNELGEFFSMIGTSLSGLVSDGGFHGVMVIVTSLLAALLSGVYSLIWAYFCIVFGAMLAKRLKLLSVILTFYIGEMIISTIASIVGIFGMFTLVATTEYRTEFMSIHERYAMTWLVILCASAVIAVVSSLFYRYTVAKLERDLNLA